MLMPSTVTDLVAVWAAIRPLRLLLPPDIADLAKAVDAATEYGPEAADPPRAALAAALRALPQPENTEPLPVWLAIEAYRAACDGAVDDARLAARLAFSACSLLAEAAAERRELLR